VGHNAPVRPRLTLVVGAALLIAAVAGTPPSGAAPRARAAASASAGGTALDPSAFSAGACVAFPPTEGDRHQTVFLDAGHGGVDPGGVGTTGSGQTVTEATVNLAVALQAAASLRSRGYRVVLSRTGDTSVAKLGWYDLDDYLLSVRGVFDDVAARDVCANLARATVLVGVYMDSAADPSAAGSLSAYDSARPFAAQSQRLAGDLQAAVLSALDSWGWQIPDDGVVDDTELGSLVGDPDLGGLAAEAAAYDHLLLLGPAQAGYFTTPSQMPGAVIEPLYLTDPFEGGLAASPLAQRVMGEALAAGVAKYLGAAPAAESA